MEEKLVFSTEEQDTANGLLSKLLANDANGFQPNDAEKLRQRIDQYVHSGTLQRNIFGLNPIVYALETAEIAFDEIGLKRDAIIAIVLYTDRKRLWPRRSANNSRACQGARAVQKNTCGGEREF